MLRGIVDNVGFCRPHLFAQLDIVDVVFDVDKNELLSSVPNHLLFKVYHHQVPKKES